MLELLANGSVSINQNTLVAVFTGRPRELDSLCSQFARSCTRLESIRELKDYAPVLSQATEATYDCDDSKSVPSLRFGHSHL